MAGLTGLTSKGTRVDIEIKGLAEANLKVQELIASDIKAGVMALREFAETEMTEAKRRTPVDNGILRDSGHVKTLDDFTLQLGFGGPAGSGNLDRVTNKKDVGYALVVHEDLEALHTVGQAKYLESTLLESIPYMAERVAKTMIQIRGGA